MSSRTAAILVDAGLAAAYNSAPKTKQKKALSAMRNALQTAPASKTKAPRLSKKETELFLKINRTLSEDKQQRYEALTEKRIKGSLTKKEHAQFTVEHIIPLTQRRSSSTTREKLKDSHSLHLSKLHQLVSL